ncbi:phage tail protein [Novosphingobium sp.]|uniref:GTA baseplate fiber-binding domain-containing protein n=1 Tax=Novosphingobium sp. TaxID=1874826 RepID=UPI00260F61CF|nr:phage tail protein [Novosphingobium sp.]
MATIIFTALGRALGGRAGGAVGALLGRQLDGLLIGSGRTAGPRLSDLSVTTSSYGEPIPRPFGRMRLAGSIIWATDLRETSETRGGGKGRPAQTTYSYSASFAVALASRPLAAIGRIWADGVLLRGAEGDLKTGGQLRFHAGHGDQMPDPLLSAAEGAARCPAYRGIAYVVFEDLPLADFGNRIPALSFEVFGPESALDLVTVTGLGGTPADPAIPLEGVAGISIDGSPAETLGLLADLVPFACDGAADRPVLRPEPGEILPLPEAAGALAGSGSATGRGGPARRWTGAAATPLGALRYLDVARDYQAGLQRVPTAAAKGQPRVLELPLALTSEAARLMVDAAARRETWLRQSLVWRSAALDPRLGPGALVRAPGMAGVWRVTEWEWRADGVEVTLWRVPPTAATATSLAADAGRAALAPDQRGGPSALAAFELPWDGTSGRDIGQGQGSVVVAASSAAPGWTGAALYWVDANGGLVPAGVSGRTRAVLGHAEDRLAPASPLLPDRASRVVVALLDPEMTLGEATGAQLANGANRALLGDEIVQFAGAVPLGGGRWQLSGLLRGQGGTEAVTAAHRPGERFVLLDPRLPVLDRSAAPGATRVAAIGLEDPDPVVTEVALPGIAARPLAPVHPTARTLPDGSLALGWTRRARGAWSWVDGADAPLHEEFEGYEVLAGSAAHPFARWDVAEPRLILAAEALRALRATQPDAALLVRQRGSYAVSEPLLLTHLS